MRLHNFGPIYTEFILPSARQACFLRTLFDLLACQLVRIGLLRICCISFLEIGRHITILCIKSCEALLHTPALPIHSTRSTALALQHAINCRPNHWVLWTLWFCMQMMQGGIVCAIIQFWIPTMERSMNVCMERLGFGAVERIWMNWKNKVLYIW